MRAFWEHLEGFDGTLVSFNGRGFDLPVLELRPFTTAAWRRATSTSATAYGHATDVTTTSTTS